MRPALFAWAMLVLAAFLVAGTPAKAGILEIFDDEVTRERYCDIEPCWGHNRHQWQSSWYRDRYLRYHIVKEPAQYEWRVKRVMVAPPLVVLKERPGTYDWIGGRHVLVATDKETVTLEGPEYEDLETPVLVRPARYKVYRDRPYRAYYHRRIAVPEYECSFGARAGHC